MVTKLIFSALSYQFYVKTSKNHQSFGSFLKRRVQNQMFQDETNSLKKIPLWDAEEKEEHAMKIDANWNISDITNAT